MCQLENSLFYVTGMLVVVHGNSVKSLCTM